MQMVVNELSMLFPVDSIDRAKVKIIMLLDVYRRLIQLGFDRIVLSESSLEGIVLADDYPIEKWRNDNTVDVELKRRFAVFNDKMEFIYRHDYLAEFECTDGKSIGCLVAHETETIVISFNSHPNWNLSRINGKIVRLIEDSVVEQEAIVLNASTLENINDIKDDVSALLHSQKYSIDTYQKLWEDRKTLFPNLVFCSRVEYFLDNLHRGYIKQVVKKLQILDVYFSEWDRIFDKNRLSNVDPESTETLSRFSEEHTFKLPDGRELLFSFHSRFTGSYEGRIYFIPDHTTGKGIIGHIGGKLPTVRWSNPN
jgi:hypothetical protein